MPLWKIQEMPFISPLTGFPTDMTGAGPGRILVVCNGASAGQS